MELIKGKYLSIHEHNICFRDVSLFILEHLDTPDRSNSIVVLGSYIFYPTDYFRGLYPNKKIIIYQLEQIVQFNWHNNDYLNWIGESDEVWEYDIYNSAVLTERNIKHSMMDFRYCKSLDKSLNDTNEYDIDVLFYGFMNHRRLNIIEPLQQNNYGRLRFVYAFGIDTDELDKYIKRSKIILNIHAFDENRQEKVRMLRPLCNGKMIISEHSQPSFFSDYIKEFSSVPMMNDLIWEYLKLDKFKEFGEQARNKFKNKNSDKIQQPVPQQSIMEIRESCVINAVPCMPPLNIEEHKKDIYGFDFHFLSLINLKTLLTETL